MLRIIIYFFDKYLFMVKSKFARFIDTFVFFSGIFIVSFAWINKYIKMTLLSFFITFVISLIVGKIVWNLSTKNSNKKSLKMQELKFAENCIDYLSLHPANGLCFFNKLIDDSQIVDNYLVCNNTIHYFDYSSDQTTTNTLVKLTNKLKNGEKAFLYSSKLSEKCTKLINQTSVVWVQDYDCFLLMKEKNLYPITQQINEKVKKQKIKQALLNSFTRKKAKPYFLYGLLLLFSSFVMPYSLLYCIVGSVSIAFALICILARNNQIINKNLS